MYRIIRCYSTGRVNYYDVLGVSKSATQKEIKQAFITLSKKYHPDITGSNEAATKKFVQVKEAYDVLRDEQKRREYDSMGSGFGGNPFGGYGSYGSQGRYPGSQPFNEDIFKQFRQGNTRYEFRYRGGKFTNEDFERIWKEFQKMTQNPQNARYDERMFREARQRVWDEFSRKREESWRKRAEEHAKRYPFDNMQTNPLNSINWERFNKMLILYVGAFFVVALLQTIYSSGERHYQKSLDLKPAQSQTITPNETLRDLMNRPPITNPEQARHDKPQFNEDRPFGYPQN